MGTIPVAIVGSKPDYRAEEYAWLEKEVDKLVFQAQNICAPPLREKSAYYLLVNQAIEAFIARATPDQTLSDLELYRFYATLPNDPELKKIFLDHLKTTWCLEIALRAYAPEIFSNSLAVKSR